MSNKNLLNGERLEFGNREQIRAIRRLENECFLNEKEIPSEITTVTKLLEYTCINCNKKQEEEIDVMYYPGDEIDVTCSDCEHEYVYDMNQERLNDAKDVKR